MNKDKFPAVATTDLRRQAENRLREDGEASFPSGSAADPQRLLHELQVHRIELEMQNAELRQAWDELESMLGKYTGLYDYAPVGYLTLDRDGLISAANLTAACLLEVERSRLTGRRFGQLLAASDLSSFSSFLNTVFTSQGRQTCTMALPREGNRPLMVQIEAVAAAGGAECLMTLTDIGDRMEVEDALSRSNERLNLALSASKMGVWEWDLQSNDVFWSPECHEIVGLREFNGRFDAFAALIHPDDAAHVRETVDKAVAQRTPYTDEFRIIRPDGQERWLFNLGRPTYDSTGVPLRLIGTVQDITRRQQIEKELLEKNVELEDFAFTVSHDLKSPLITIQTYAGFIRQDLEAGRHERIPEDLARIADASAKMGMLLENLLELSRIGRMMNPPTAVDMGRLAADVLAQLAGPLAQKRVDVAVQPNLPTVHGDRQRIAEVLQNLVENAIKYMGDQQSPRIEIGARVAGNECVFYVGDNGAGIDPQHRERIFGLFTKLDAGSEGTGIGLALVKRIVEVHGGRVWVESAGVGRGSTFCFTLPDVTRPEAAGQSRAYDGVL